MSINRRFSTAPMMDWSDKHCRYFWRQLTKDTLLYTEMVTTGALIHGNRDRFLEYNDIEHPIALQLGGSNPSELATCSRYAEEWGYDEVNLNVGCPSDRVQNNMIGACLMAHPQLVADCIKAMQDSTSIDVTIKHRIGIDDQDSYEHMRDFVATVAETGCKTFIVHARKAILQGLSPKENREVPPLRYDDVYRLKQEFPDLEIIINGGIKTHKQIAEIMPHVDGVMLGREAYQNPSVLIDADELYFGKPANTESAKDAVRALYPYIETLLAKGAPLHYVSRHILGLFNGQRGARLFRRYLSERAHLRESGIQVLEEALQLID
ncbi:MAG: tRNA dihydrouridine(20/20a) synthase DusA [Pseudomonadota bacterium]|uniref:tRNA dihydrouridine(20/20a) synthase DusA n=1 Tax=Thalassolituus sp. UBA2590 TaxID=1947663 RepID=UPI0026480CB8|nr:tRNA dihydrouridine(20/20a) synthase DusA [Thalassolituus sp. UBA2590]MEC9255519.1 tRNA dihydrouridine(20/20a) synthase DusA [Pseudomonadota bacterium]MEC9409709.1 tRNA dihydrouridine(20/20a) synthase DusA [Pseudomonadota bacterium]MEE3160313.1 tRNA dihydrouridine(20/20a) synthase DusA [Pseudomonadota bacterium]MEE3191682.1 tRNA dihydrouridine(20/20a) synthase DusA [Pseudomonadota bacterium]